MLRADMAELADALDLGSSGNTRAGSTPVIRTSAEGLIINGFRDCRVFLFLCYTFAKQVFSNTFLTHEISQRKRGTK